MKARNVIPGWPRGRSTSPPSGQGEPPLWGFWWRNRYPFHLAMVEDEIDSNLRYHKAQQRMVDEWRKGTHNGWPIDPRMARKSINFVLKPSVAEMKRRLFEDPTIREAEAMGFEFEIKLPNDSITTVPPIKDLRHE